jgi:hypothetical protein
MAHDPPCCGLRHRLPPARSKLGGQKKPGTRRPQAGGAGPLLGTVLRSAGLALHHACIHALNLFAALQVATGAVYTKAEEKNRVHRLYGSRRGRHAATPQG